jgi:hypothetical protein
LGEEYKCLLIYRFQFSVKILCLFEFTVDKFVESRTVYCNKGKVYYKLVFLRFNRELKGFRRDNLSRL